MPSARTFVLGTLWAALAVGAGPAPAAERAAGLLTIKQISFGFGGKFKAGFWQSVRVTVVAGPASVRGRLELVVPDGDQMPVVYHDARSGELNLAANEEQTLLLYAKSGPLTSAYTVRLRDSTGAIWSAEITPHPAPLRSTQELIVGLGPSIGLDAAVATIRRRSDLTLQSASVRSAVELPDHWWGYDGVDTLALATSDAEFLSALTDAQRQAILQWVVLGGRIVLCVGARGAEVAAAGSPWKPLIPGEFVETSALRERSGLEGFTKAELPFDDPQFQRNRPYVTRLNNIRGEVLLDEVSSAAGRPLAIHATYGLGQVTFVGLDLDHPSLRNWKGQPRLLAAVLQRGAAEREQSDREFHRSVTHLGYDDLIGQLRAALDQFSGVSLVNFTTVSVLTIIYLLLIGPADFLLLSRLGWPRHVTWVTFPLVAVGMIALAVMLGGQVHGQRLRSNQLEIIDIDLAQQMARGTVWCHLYSPSTRPFDAALSVTSPLSVVSRPTEGWLTWQGLPGDSLGGLESQQPSLILREAYTVMLPGGQPRIEAMTVQVASSKSLSGCWWSKTELPGDTQLSVDRYGLLAGEFRHPLLVTLSDCMLAHGEKLYRLGTLGEGQRVRMADLPPLNLEARLTERRVEQSKDVSTPWEQDSLDIPRIVQMLMFHESARGRSYTGLTHRYQSRIDLSEHVRLGQAILVGRSSAPVARLTDGSSAAPLSGPDGTAAWTWYRIVLPVGSNPTPDS